VYALRGLAGALIWLGRYGKARGLLQRALHLLDDTDSPADRASIYRAMARSYAREGKHGPALPNDEQALALYRLAGDRAGQATALNAIGWHHAHLGEPAKELGDRHGVAVTADSLGYIHRNLGQHDQAISWYQRAIDIFDEVGDQYEMADTLATLGDTFAAIGRLDEAQAARSRAAVTLDELGVARALH
jgi:tetratricopeptide (TPR) repeat protein